MGVRPDRRHEIVHHRKAALGTLVALLRGGKPVLGIWTSPCSRERWLGVDGEPSTLNGDVISTRRCGALRDAYMYATTPP